MFGGHACASIDSTCDSADLPLVSFFETSFGRSYDRTFLLVTPARRGCTKAGAKAVAEANPYYSSETTETAWHIITEFLAPRVLGRDFEHPRDVFDALRPGPRPQHGQGDASKWPRGICTRASQQQPLSRVLGGTRDRIASGVSIGIQDSLDQLTEKVAASSPPAISASRSRSSRAGISPPSRRCAQRFGDDPADGRRQRRLHARRRARISPALDAYDSDDDRTAARLRRCDRPRRAAAADRDADLPGRIDSHRAHRPRRDCRRRLPDHQHQARPRRRSSRIDPAARSVRRPTAFRSGTAACSKPASAARTTSTLRACRTSRCRATSPRASATTQPDLIDPPIDVAADGTIAVPTALVSA